MDMLRLDTRVLDVERHIATSTANAAANSTPGITLADVDLRIAAALNRDREMIDTRIAEALNEFKATYIDPLHQEMAALRAAVERNKSRPVPLQSPAPLPGAQTIPIGFPQSTTESAEQPPPRAFPRSTTISAEPDDTDRAIRSLQQKLGIKQEEGDSHFRSGSGSGSLKGEEDGECIGSVLARDVDQRFKDVQDQIAHLNQYNSRMKQKLEVYECGQNVRTHSD